MSGRYQEKMETTPAEMLVEYQTNNQHFSQNWKTQIGNYLLLFSREDITTPENDATRSQLIGLAKKSHTHFTLAEQYLYHCLREAKHLGSEATDNTGVHPQRLTDERLIIEICLYMNDTMNAQAVIWSSPSTRFKPL